MGFDEGAGRVIFTSMHQEFVGVACVEDVECDATLTCVEGVCGEELVPDGPEEATLRYLLLSL